MIINKICCSYFSGVLDLWNHRARSCQEKSCAAVKIFINLVLLPVSIALGAIYGICLFKERCSQSVPQPQTANKAAVVFTNAILSTPINETGPKILHSEPPEPSEQALGRVSVEEVTKVVTSAEGLSEVAPTLVERTFSPSDSSSSSSSATPSSSAVAIDPQIKEEHEAILAEQRKQNELINLQIKRSGIFPPSKSLKDYCTKEVVELAIKRKIERTTISESAAIEALEKSKISLDRRVFLFGGYWEDPSRKVFDGDIAPSELGIPPGSQTKTFKEIAQDIVRMINLVIVNQTDPRFIQNSGEPTLLLHKELNPYDRPTLMEYAINVEQYMQIGITKFDLIHGSRGRSLVDRIFESWQTHGIIQDFSICRTDIEILL